jgi:hypothetical protein
MRLELVTARDSMKWVTVRLIMRIAHGVAAAAAAAGLEQFSWWPGRARGFTGGPAPYRSGLCAVCRRLAS